MRRIRMQNTGRYAFVDDEDYELLSEMEWRERNGYAVSGKFRMHRLVMCAPLGVIVDHVDRNPLNNQKDNLRFATHAQNVRNRKQNSNATTDYKGVLRAKNRGFAAQVREDGRDVKGPVRETQEQAAIDYNVMSLRSYGEFARPNPLDTGLDLSALADQIGLDAAETKFMVALTNGAAYHEAAMAAGLGKADGPALFERVAEKVQRWQEAGSIKALMMPTYHGAKDRLPLGSVLRGKPMGTQRIKAEKGL